MRAEAELEHLAHETIDMLERAGIDWRSGVGEQMLIDTVVDKYQLGSESASMTQVTRTGDLGSAAPKSADGIQVGDYFFYQNEWDVLTFLTGLGLSPRLIAQIQLNFIRIGTDEITSKEAMKRLPTVEILARMIYAEQTKDTEAQTANLWALINRFFSEDGFKYDKELDGDRKTLKTLLFGDLQFTTLTREDRDIKKMQAYQQRDPSNKEWQNAKLLASYLYAILGNSTKKELLDAGITKEKVSSIISSLINIKGNYLKNPFIGMFNDGVDMSMVDSWRGGDEAPSKYSYAENVWGNWFYIYSIKG